MNYFYECPFCNTRYKTAKEMHDCSLECKEGLKEVITIYTSYLNDLIKIYNNASSVDRAEISIFADKNGENSLISQFVPNKVEEKVTPKVRIKVKSDDKNSSTDVDTDEEDILKELYLDYLKFLFGI